MNESLLYKVKVVEIIVETRLAKTFVLQPMYGWKPLFKPGQFLTLLFFNSGVEKRRSFSLTSDPSENNLSITVKRIPNGEYSRYMLDHILPGDEFYTTGIAGFFTLPELKDEKTKQLFFLAAGSGIAPVYALITEALKRWTDVSIVLVYSNRNENDVIF